jgi:hypothetical protein
VKRDFERVTLEDGIVQYEMLLQGLPRRGRTEAALRLSSSERPDNTMIFKFAEIKNNAPLADAAFAKPEK